MAKKREITDKQRLQFARNIEMFFDASYSNWKRLLLLSVVRGLATGAGVVLGGTIVIALLLWGLSGLEQVPLLGEFAEKTRTTIQENEQ